MTDHSTAYLKNLPIAGDLIGENFEGWSDSIKKEFEELSTDGHVGSKLLFENHRVRVWEIRLQPGQRWHAHCHALDYFWTAITAGRSRQRTFDGATREVSYQPGDTRFYAFGPGESLLHDLENIGETELVFSTVELIEGSNTPLPLND
jgi:uncharacterized cupin superfamily protein